MISQLKRIGLCAALFMIAACSGGRNQQNASGDVFDTSSYSIPTYNTSSTNLPTNLFDTSTSQDPAATTTSTNYGPITQSASYCLSNDMYMFGGTQQGCYGSQSYVTPNQLWSAGLTMYSSLDQALAYAKSLQPQTSDPAEARQKMALAKMIIARAVRQQLRSQWGFTTWSTDQNQVYSQSDAILRSWITQAGQNF